MIRYKKRGALALLVVMLLLTALFAGCESKVTGADLLTVRQRETGKTVSIGYTRAQVEEVTGDFVSGGWDFMSDGTVGDYYNDAPGIRVDYLDDVVVRFMLAETGDWEFMNGVYPGMAKEDAEKLYKDVKEKEAGEQGGIFISYDENFVPIPYDEFSPYVLQIGFNGDVVESCYIQFNF